MLLTLCKNTSQGRSLPHGGGLLCCCPKADPLIKYKSLPKISQTVQHIDFAQNATAGNTVVALHLQRKLCCSRSACKLCNLLLAFTQGGLDGGLDIPHGDKRFVGYDTEAKKLDTEQLKKYILGGHVGPSRCCPMNLCAPVCSTSAGSSSLLLHCYKPLLCKS